MFGRLHHHPHCLAEDGGSRTGQLHVVAVVSKEEGGKLKGKLFVLKGVVGITEESGQVAVYGQVAEERNATGPVHRRSLNKIQQSVLLRDRRA